jgi:hypothetical protein
MDNTVIGRQWGQALLVSLVPLTLAGQLTELLMTILSLVRLRRVDHPLWPLLRPIVLSIYYVNYFA